MPCPVCSNLEVYEIRGKFYCTNCKTLLEVCCEGSGPSCDKKES